VEELVKDALEGREGKATVGSVPFLPYKIPLSPKVLRTP